MERHLQTAGESITAMLTGQSLLEAKWWGWVAMAYWIGHNAMSNHLCPESSPNMAFEKKTTNMEKMLKFAFGDPVIVAKTGSRQKHPGIPKNEFGVVLSAGTKLSGAVYVWLPERKNNFVALRHDVKLINLGNQQIMTAEESKSLLPQINDDGTVYLKSKPDIQKLLKSITKSLNYDVDENINDLELSIRKRSTLDIEDENGDQSVEIFNSIPNPKLRKSERLKIPEQESIQELEANGIKMILEDPSIDVNEIMAYGSAVYDDYSWNHPKWEDAIKRVDREKWLEADRVEQERLMAHQCIPYLDEFAEDGGYNKVPKGRPVIHCMRICWIKPNGIYKLRIIYFGNQEDFNGDTFSPTGSSQAFWLISHLGLILCLKVACFDLENAFCHEPCPRDLYVVLDGKVRKPVNQFYGGKDGPITFNKGFVEHNEQGGYQQSKK